MTGRRYFRYNVCTRRLSDRLSFCTTMPACRLHRETCLWFLVRLSNFLYAKNHFKTDKLFFLVAVYNKQLYSYVWLYACCKGSS